MRISPHRLASLSARARCGRIVAFDTETTGCMAWDEICQIAAVEYVAGAPARSLALYVRPSCRMNPFAQAIHGLSMAFLREHGLPPVEAMRRFFDFIGRDALLVAHNAPFDLRMLRQECAKFRLPHSIASLETCDTLYLSRRLCPELPNHRLATMVAALGAGGSNTHDALDDATACALLFFKLLELPGSPSPNHAAPARPDTPLPRPERFGGS
jgi:DNA helicase-2/ATP-dependent DNA helicase PcrA